MTMETWQLALFLVITTMPILLVTMMWINLNLKCRNRKDPASSYQESDFYAGSFLAGISAEMTDTSAHRSVDNHHLRHRPGNGKLCANMSGDLQ